jgi:hypothetical protein
MIGECQASYTVKFFLDIDNRRRNIVPTHDNCFVLIQRSMLSQWQLNLDVDQDVPSSLLAGQGRYSDHKMMHNMKLTA